MQPETRTVTKPSGQSGRWGHGGTQVQRDWHVQSLEGSSDAKNKTQVASSTSMAVIHVGILKFLLDADRESVSYYNLSLDFVLAALVLQLITGIIAICIATMKSFLSQFQGDFSNYWKTQMCPCLADGGKDVPMGNAYQAVATETVTSNDDEGQVLCCICCVPKTHPAFDLQPSRRRCVCCIEWGSSPGEPRMSNYEDELFKDYKCWLKKSLDLQTEAVSQPEKLCVTECEIKQLLAKLHTLYETNPEEDDPEIAQIKYQLESAEQRLQVLTSAEMEWSACKKKGEVLRSRLVYMQEDKVMKKAAFWQCVYTFLTYIVFALNTVITGFGLSQGTYAHAGNSTTPS